MWERRFVSGQGRELKDCMFDDGRDSPETLEAVQGGSDGGVYLSCPPESQEGPVFWDHSRAWAAMSVIDGHCSPDHFLWGGRNLVPNTGLKRAAVTVCSSFGA